jgi:cytochrome c oxidase subunit 2
MDPNSAAQKGIRIAIFLGCVAVGGVMGAMVTPKPPDPRERQITIRARQYAYDPAILRVNQGDTLRLSFISEDVLKPEFQVIRPSDQIHTEMVKEVVVTAKRGGKYRYRCSHTCGYMHPFMQGEMIVAPNRLFPVSVGMGLGVLLGGLIVAVSMRQPS